MRALPLAATGLTLDLAFGLLHDTPGTTSDTVNLLQLLAFSAAIASTAGLTLWRSATGTPSGQRPALAGWRAGLWLGCGMATGELVYDGSNGGQWLPPYPEALIIMVLIVMLLTAWTAEYAHARVGAPSRGSLRAQALIGLVPMWLVFAFVLQGWQTYSPEYGWNQSSKAVYAALGLSGNHPPELIRFAAVLAYSPGADTSLSALWWTVSLLWLIPAAHLLLRRRQTVDAAVNDGNAAGSGGGTGLAGLRPSMRAGLIGVVVCLVGLLATRIAVAPTVGQGGMDEATAYYTWMVLVITCAMAVTAMTVAAVIRGSYPLLQMLATSGTVAVVATIAGFIRESTDGCLGPANTGLIRTCSFHPEFSAEMIEAWIGYAFGPALLIAMGAGSAVYAARHLLRRTGGRTAPTQPVRAPGRRWPAALAAAAGLLIVAGQTAHSSAQTTTSTSDAALSTIFVAPTPSPSTERLQVEAWVKYAGLDLLNEFTPLNSTFTDDMGRLADAPAADLPALAERIIPPACSALFTLTGNVNSALPVPVADGQLTWARVSDALDDAASACHRFNRSHQITSFIAAFDDFFNAENEGNTLIDWIGPASSIPGTTPVVADLGGYQPFDHEGVTFRFTAENLTIEPDATAPARSHPGDRVATLDVEACIAGIPPNELVGGQPQGSDWRLSFPDGTVIAPALSWPSQDFNATEYADNGDEDLTAPGDCDGGLIGFDIPSSETGAPTRVLFTSTTSPNTPAWNVPTGTTTDTFTDLGTTQPTGTASGTWVTVSGYAVRKAATNHEHLAPGDRIATITVQACGPGNALTAPAAWADWEILLADGATATPVSTWSPRDFQGPLFPDGRTSIGSARQCRTGLIPFAIPAADQSDPVEIDDNAPSYGLSWSMVPPSQ